MRIAIIAHQLRVAGGLSIGKNIISSLSRVAAEHDYLLFMPTGVGYESTDKPPRSEFVYFQRRFGSLGQAWFEWFGLSGRIRQWRPDLVWGLGNFGLARPGANQAILFHKAHYVYPPEHSRIETASLRFRNAIAKRRLIRGLPATQLVFCQTRTIADRFRQSLVFKGRIAILPNAVSRFARCSESPGRPPVFDALRGRFTLLCLSRYYAHKNLEALVEAFRRHSDELADAAVVLTVGPNDHPRVTRFLEEIRKPPVCGHIFNVGPVDQTELAAYYGASDGLILPTLLESFSGTYLEAMQFKRPILTSDLDFARDVCGDAAEYFDPHDPASMRDAILRVKNDDARRAELIAAGASRLETHVRDWDSIVREAMTEIEALF